jgi:hypothetical protein
MNPRLDQDDGASVGGHAGTEQLEKAPAVERKLASQALTVRRDERAIVAGVREQEDEDIHVAHLAS